MLATLNLKWNKETTRGLTVNWGFVRSYLLIIRLWTPYLFSILYFPGALKGSMATLFLYLQIQRNTVQLCLIWTKLVRVKPQQRQKTHKGPHEWSMRKINACDNLRQQFTGTFLLLMITEKNPIVLPFCWDYSNNKLQFMLLKLESSHQIITKADYIKVLKYKIESNHLTIGLGWPETVQNSLTGVFSHTVWALRLIRKSGALGTSTV